MTRTLALPLACATLLACSRDRDRPPGTEGPEVRGDLGVISPAGMAGVAPCDPSNRVASLFELVRDTVVPATRGGAPTPAHVVPIDEDEWTLYVASPPDTTRISRMATNSVRYRTGRRWRVGMAVGALRERAAPHRADR